MRLFWVKMISGIIFPQIRMFGCNGKWNFPEIHFMLTEIYAFDPEMNLHFHFHFNSFPERERERERGREKRESPNRRERERERKKRLRRRSCCSSEDRTANQSTSGAIDEQCDRPTSVLVDRAPHRSRLRASRSLIDKRHDWRALRSSDERARRLHPSSIAPLIERLHRSRLRFRLHRAISSSPPPHDLNLTGFDEFFCWVLFLLWMSVELIHYLHVYSWGSVWKIGHVKHFL